MSETKTEENQRFLQQNIEADALMNIAEYPLAMKIYLLIIRKMDTKNALVASYRFFMDYFKASKTTVWRAVRKLEGEKVLQVKRCGGTTVFLMNPDIGNHREVEGTVVFAETEWGKDDNDEYADRRNENTIVMEIGYQSRFDEMFFGSDTKAGAILTYIIREMDENNEFVGSLNDIAKALRYSRSTVSRAVKLFREKYSDLVTVSKRGVVSKFSIDKDKCFKA